MIYTKNKMWLFFFCTLLCLFVVFIKVNKVHAASPNIKLNVNSVASASNGYGGVDIDVAFENIGNENYVYEIKRSTNYIYWQNIGLGFNYNKKTEEIVPKKIKVLNVYPDNDSFILSDELKSVYSKETIETMKKVYAIENGTYEYSDNTSAVMPHSASLKVWIEGGKYIDDKKTYFYQDLSYYNGYKMLEVSQMSMKKFNSTVKSSSDLKGYDTIFFGTWDANGWNDLNATTYKAVKDYIDEGRGVIFGHDTISYEISANGVFTGRFEHEYMCKLYKTAGFKTIPKKYEDSSLIKKNSAGLCLPVDYQIWGGDTKKSQVTVMFSKTKRAEDSSLTTFPYDLLGTDGTPRNLRVPQTHTSWMGLQSKNNNIVSFVNNEYDILPESVRDSYQNKPNLEYNWYLSSVSSNDVCYAIQTGHKRNDSLEDERKLIANVLCSSYRKEKVEKYEKSKIDTSAQDKEPPKVYEPEFIDSDSSGFNIKFSGEDFGTLYFYKVILNDIDNKTAYFSDEVNTTITTGIKNYYYIVDNKADNYDFDIDDADKVSVTENETGVHINTNNITNCYLHIKSIDNAGNISSAIVIDMSKKIFCGVYPVDISCSNEKYLFKGDEEEGVRTCYINGKSPFTIEGGCYINPYYSIAIQPQKNYVGKYWLTTELDKRIGEGKTTLETDKKLDGLVNVITAKQARSDKSRKLKYEILAKFVSGNDGKNDYLLPAAIISNNGTIERVNGDKKTAIRIYCDESGPQIEYDSFNAWYNADNSDSAFKLNVDCKDECSGFDKCKVTLYQSEITGWKNLAEKTSNKESDTYDFLAKENEGKFQYTVCAFDNVNNTNTIRINFGVDKTPPVIKNLEGCYGWTNQNVNVNISAEDELSGIKSIKLYDDLGNVLKEANGDSLNYCFENECDSTFYMVSEDIAGNVSEKYFFKVRIDKSAPVLSLDGMSEDSKSVENGNVFYYLPANTLNYSAQDFNHNNICSGLKSLTLKNQNNQVLVHLENDDENIKLNSQLFYVHEVVRVDDGDYYSIVAVDAADNVKKVFVVPKICIQNRIKRYIVHDNFEEEYGYYRIYE